MEELLNKLIEKGWKPFGIKSDNICLYCLSDNKIVISYYEFNSEGECDHEDKWCDLRQLTSKESGLWQFCVENKLVTDRYNDWTLNATTYCEDCDIDYDIRYWETDYEYRIIESSLKDESELEYFLLSNIKVDGTTK